MNNLIGWTQLRSSDAVITFLVRINGVRILISIAFLLSLDFASAEDCISRWGDKGVTSGYVLQDGLAHDNKNNLTWQRCPHGQSYSQDRCRGTIKQLTLNEANQLARKTGQGWRLPTINELGSLIRKSCKPPMLDQQAFPDVRAYSEGKSKYWSSSRVQDIPGMTYNLDFIDAGVDANTPGIAMAVRLVKTGHP